MGIETPSDCGPYPFPGLGKEWLPEVHRVQVLPCQCVCPEQLPHPVGQVP